MSTLISKNAQIGADPTATNNFTIYQPATPDGTLRIGNGNTGITSSLLTLTSAGNLGIGTSTAPGSNGGGLAIYRSDYPRLTFRNSTTGDTTTAGTQFVAAGLNFEIYNKQSGYIDFGTGNISRMLLDSSGNLGLGVTPSAWGAGLTALQLTNGGSLATQTGAVLLSQNKVNSGGDKYISNGFASDYYQLNGTHAWRTAPSGTAGNAISFTQAMTLTASGRLFLANTSGYSTEQLSVSFTAGSQGIATGVVSTASQSHLIFLNPNGTVGSITTNGSGTLYNITSDQRLKENIQDSASASSLIDSLQVRQYDWKSDGSHQRYGFIAQELVNVAPEAVHQPANPDDMMAVDYSKLVPMLVKEIQSLRARVAQLEAK